MEIENKHNHSVFFGSLLELNHTNWWFGKKALQNLEKLDHSFP
jgi:hypothetical protein